MNRYWYSAEPVKNYKKEDVMGTGIFGGIVIDLAFDNQWDRDYFLKRKGNEEFLKFYSEVETHEKGRIFYTFDYPNFVREFKDYFYLFHSLIETNLENEDLKNFTGEYEAIEKENDLQACISYLKDSDGDFPAFWERNRFSVLGFNARSCIIIYRGSYKAYLEEYTTLDDMEKLLVKACSHPLAKITKFGIFG
jgi:hypothetical protein